MRILIKDKPRYGECRVVDKFLMIPRVLINPKGDKEFRWLEKSRIKQRYGFGFLDMDMWISEKWEEN